MIYITNSTTAQVVYVPASEAKVSGNLTFSLKSMVNRKTPVSASVTQLGDSDLYYKFTLTLAAPIDNGEYGYTLKKGDEVLCSGLAMVGTLASNEEYNNTTEYEQYESAD